MAGIFSRFIFNNAIFNTDGAAPPSPSPSPAGGSFSRKKFKKYADKLTYILTRKPQNTEEWIEFNRVVDDLSIRAPDFKEIAQRIERSVRERGKLTQTDREIEELQTQLISFDLKIKRQEVNRHNAAALALLL